jgi:hypothetical protein
LQKKKASLCFAALLSDPREYTLLHQSADLGYPFAQAKMAGLTYGSFLQNLLHLKRERGGFFWLWVCYEKSDGCEMDLEKAKEYHLIAAQLGFVFSMTEFGRLLDASDPQRWVWLGRAALLRDSYTFLCSFSDQVEKFNSGSGNGGAVFQIGKSLNGHVSVEKRAFFGLFAQLINPANFAVSFYKSQLAACRRAVDT